jgi:hypothetical protein
MITLTKPWNMESDLNSLMNKLDILECPRMGRTHHGRLTRKYLNDASSLTLDTETPSDHSTARLLSLYNGVGQSTLPEVGDHRAVGRTYIIHTWLQSWLHKSFGWLVLPGSRMQPQMMGSPMHMMTYPRSNFTLSG